MTAIMIILFLIVAVAGRVLIQYKLTGEHGIRIVSSSSTKTNIVSSILIVISFIGVISVSSASEFIKLETLFITSIYSQLIGVVFCFMGILLTSISQIQMGKEWRIGVNENEKNKLITHGLYSVIRNPIYTGVIIFGLGLIILLPNSLMLIFATLGYLSIEIHVRKVEEPYLKRIHGETYENYLLKTGRYVPK